MDIISVMLTRTQEPNLTTPKLSLLIDSLASGADVFAMSGKGDVGEMAMVVD